MNRLMYLKNLLRYRYFERICFQRRQVLDEVSYEKLSNSEETWSKDTVWTQITLEESMEKAESKNNVKNVGGLIMFKPAPESKPPVIVPLYLDPSLSFEKHVEKVWLLTLTGTESQGFQGVTPHHRPQECLHRRPLQTRTRRCIHRASREDYRNYQARRLYQAI